MLTLLKQHLTNPDQYLNNRERLVILRQTYLARIENGTKIKLNNNLSA